MKISEPILLELQFESAGTRRMLERLPEDKFSWQPHPKSQTLGALTSQLVEIPRWLSLIMTTSEWTIPEDYEPTIYANVPAVLKAFDENLAVAEKTLQSAEDETFFRNWRFLAGGHEIFNLPRMQVIRGMVLNHAIHHRGQLSVYLRLLNVPLPAIYGPTADEQS